ncbi:MAG: hypothetical protein TR69_WS6001000278 [candidate division WS6 bacterium OLB20]|uniref:DUF3179 domain-containing protein n=1 Tax=candidate division WS6 bacterium OLB20 TaxID=1617426 RepID=A0A136M0I0_9BACT|nr:MAG: hypothetical protein TR69_WS6001000278 [candidate division WS6 bacterium OLB20]
MASITDRASSIFGLTNRIWTVVALFTLGIAILTTIGRGGDESILSEQTFFSCPTTSAEEARAYIPPVLDPDPEISSFDFEKQTAEINGYTEQVIPVTDPQLADPEDLVTCLSDSDTMIVITVEGESRMYPLRLLEKHALVNDTLAGIPVAVSYCFTCDSVTAFERVYKNEIMDMHTSGIIYRNADLLYDLGHRTYWSHLTGKALAGPLTGATLDRIEVWRGSFADARDLFPDAQTATFVTGYNLNYTLPAFLQFDRSNTVLGPVLNVRNEIPPKERIVGFTYNNGSYAVPLDTLVQEGSAVIKLGGQLFEIDHTAGYPLLKVNGQIQPEIQLYSMYWYVWADHYPETRLF